MLPLHDYVCASFELELGENRSAIPRPVLPVHSFSGCAVSKSSHQYKQTKEKLIKAHTKCYLGLSMLPAPLQILFSSPLHFGCHRIYAKLKLVRMYSVADSIWMFINFFTGQSPFCLQPDNCAEFVN